MIFISLPKHINIYSSEFTYIFAWLIKHVGDWESKKWKIDSATYGILFSDECDALLFRLTYNL